MRVRAEFHRRWSRLNPSERHELLSSEIREPLYRLTNNPAACTLRDNELSEQLEGDPPPRCTPAELWAEYIPILQFNELGLDALGHEDLEALLEDFKDVGGV